MKRSLMNLAHLMVLLLAVSAWAESPKPPKLEKPKQGDARYALVLWEPGTPIPGDETKHMPKIEEPDYAKFGGTLLFSNANRRVVDMPVKEARKLRKHPAVASLQRLWMGEPQSELVEPPEDSIQMRGIETETDTDLTWGPKTYQYDNSGNIKAIGSDSFVYDTAGRLIRSTVGGKTESFQYDAFGNLTEKTVAGTNPVTIPVDGASNRMIGGGYDAHGNVTMREGKLAYAYDEMNMMTSFKGGRHMVYDADDERIGVIIDSQLSRWWIRDLDGNVLREYQGQAANQVWYWEQDWVYGEGQLVGAERVTFETQSWESQRTYTFGGKRHYHLDHLGSVRMVTDNSGRAVSEHDYFAFGVTPTKAYQEQINWGDPHIDAMRFTGHQREFLGFINTENTDYLDYMHARYYDPNLARFLSVDPLGGNPIAPQTWNRYSYVRNNPINYVDPTGMAECPAGTTEGVDCFSYIIPTLPDPGPSTSMMEFLSGNGSWTIDAGVSGFLPGRTGKGPGGAYGIQFSNTGVYLYEGYGFVSSRGWSVTMSPWAASMSDSYQFASDIPRLPGMVASVSSPVGSVRDPSQWSVAVGVGTKGVAALRIHPVAVFHPTQIRPATAIGRWLASNDRAVKKLYGIPSMYRR